MKGRSSLQGACRSRQSAGRLPGEHILDAPPFFNVKLWQQTARPREHELGRVFLLTLAAFENAWRVHQVTDMDGLAIVRHGVFENGIDGTVVRSLCIN